MNRIRKKIKQRKKYRGLYVCLYRGRRGGGGQEVERRGHSRRASDMTSSALAAVCKTHDRKTSDEEKVLTRTKHTHTHLLCGGVSRKALLFIETKTSVPGSRPRTPEEWKNRDCRFRLLRVSTENQNHQINQSIERSKEQSAVNQSINLWSCRSISDRSTRIPPLKFNQISQSIGPPILYFEFNQSSESIKGINQVNQSSDRSSGPETKNIALEQFQSIKQ